VPVIVVFTKFDEVVPIDDGSYASSSAKARCEQLCHSLFGKGPKGIPAEIVSGDYSVPRFSAEFALTS